MCLAGGSGTQVRVLNSKTDLEPVGHIHTETILFFFFNSLFFFNDV